MLQTPKLAQNSSSQHSRTYSPKPEFTERIKQLMLDSESYFEIIRKPLPKTIRVNTIKITPEELKERLESRGWKLIQPYENKKIMIIKNQLLPGELGKTKEHLLGYYYVQELSSMMPILALKPTKQDIFLDLTAAPGSKTTQASASMQNSGLIIANDKTIPRISILNANLERCGCTNVITVRHDAVQLCKRLQETGIKFDKILLDLPCLGEGNIRSNEKTFLMWNVKMIEKLSRLQRKIALSALPLLKEQGELLYSTCTHTPEENERNVNFLVGKGLKIEKIFLPIKTRPGLTKWKNETYNKSLVNCCRIYPQDNDSEGFFLAKLKK